MCAGFSPLGSRGKDQKRRKIVEAAADPGFSRELRAGDEHHILEILSLNEEN